ncbi:MAG: hypothetical protein N3G22_03000 [Candidatus Micrarchaeota archaeon]|nr:hypothetical protein [Candidatus Micrarchaeota archaeon]
MNFALALAFAVLFFNLPYCAFLVGEGRVGEKIPILCEGQEHVFVAFPNRSTAKLSLDIYFQTYLVPESAGPHSIQCGNETRVVKVMAREGEMRLPPLERPAFDLPLLAAALFASTLAIFIFLLGRASKETVFLKSVKGKIATIVLRPAEHMKNVKIEDPVCEGFGGKPLAFSFPSLPAHTSWKYEYEIDVGLPPAPAKLNAKCCGKEIFLESKLYIEGKEVVPKKKEASLPKAKQKRKLQRAA